MADFLKKHCLGAVAMTAEGVAGIFSYRYKGMQPESIGKLCLPHERLRRELAGAESLLDEGANKIARLEAEIIELRQMLANNEHYSGPWRDARMCSSD